MAPPVQKGDTISISKDGSDGTVTTINWQQDWSDKSAKYYLFEGSVHSTGESVVVFVQKNYYDDTNLSSNIFKFGTTNGGNLDVRVDDRFQFGQKNAQGEARFLVWHDKSRSPFQHRFVQGAAVAFSNKGAQWVTKIPTWGDMVKQGMDQIKGLIGDPLRNF